MERIAVLGRGGAGKSTLARRLARERGLPVVELDRLFWRSALRPTPPGEWERIQRQAIDRERWVIDGDLGPYGSALGARLGAADTIVVLDFPLWPCVWRALRRSRETAEFWRWVLHYRRDSLPVVMAAIASAGSRAQVHRLKSPRQVERFVEHARGVIL